MAASGRDLSRTLEGGHEPFYDFPCTLCEKEGKHMEAVNYCEDCYVFMCQSCVKNHDRFPLNSRHNLRDQSQFTKVSKSALRSLPTRRCSTHLGELINIFCGDHDVVCCSVCRAIEHCNCIQIKHLPDAATDIKLSQEPNNTKSDINRLLAKVDELLANRRADISSVTKYNETVRQTIASFRAKVNKYIDDLESKSLAELESTEKCIVGTVNADINRLNQTKSKAENILKQMESSLNEGNDSDLFVQVKIGKQCVNEDMKKVDEISEAIGKEFIHFNIDPQIEIFLSSLQMFGEFTSSLTASGSANTKEGFRWELTSDSSRKVADQPKISSQYNIQLASKHNLKEETDLNCSEIRDICQLPNGNFLITDYSNKKVKRLDRNYRLVDSLKVTSHPNSVCVVDTNEVAVTLSKRTIQMIYVNRTLLSTKTFRTSNHCRGIACVGDKLFVCIGSANGKSSGCIEVYNKAGQLQHQIPRASHLPAVAERIVVIEESQHFILSCFVNDDIITIDMDGNVLHTYSDKEIKFSAGMCKDGKGHVLVTGSHSNTMHQISPKKKSMKVIMREADGIKIPWGVCYDVKQSKLLVSCYLSNDLLVYTLN